MKFERDLRYGLSPEVALWRERGEPSRMARRMLMEARSGVSVQSHHNAVEAITVPPYAPLVVEESSQQHGEAIEHRSTGYERAVRALPGI